MALKLPKIAGIVAPAILAASVSIPFLPAPSAQALPSASVPKVMAVASAAPSSENTPIFYTLLKLGLVAGGLSGATLLLAAFLFRRVVSTNTVHIVQKSKGTIAYGSGLPAGNVYYEIPTWVPALGVSVVKLPVNNFDLSLQDYEAYDEDKVPFLIDVTAFFRICEPTTAAQRISGIKDLEHQLTLIIQGAVRKVLASHKIDSILTQRSTFGQSFSQEVEGQLSEWGIQSIKSMEMMNLRDSAKSNVIASIMAKQISAIEKDSRIEVANNNRLAKVAEVENARTADVATVEAARDINIQKQLAEQQVGEASAAKDQAVGIATERSRQEVLEQQAATTEKNIAVQRVQAIRTAEIDRDRALVVAEQDKKVATVQKETALVAASQQKETTVLVAEGKLGAELKDAEAVQAKGLAAAEAEKAMRLAPVSAQIALSQEIGSNGSYQNYLVAIAALAAYQAVGAEQAKSLQGADIKVIANGGSAPGGISSLGEVFGSKGGSSLAAAVEAFAQSDIGASLLQRVSASGGGEVSDVGPQ